MVILRGCLLGSGMHSPNKVTVKSYDKIFAILEAELDAAAN